MAKAKHASFRGLESTDYTPHMRQILELAAWLAIDPYNTYGEATFDDLIRMIHNYTPDKILGVSDPEEYAGEPGAKFDRTVAAFVQGCGGSLAPWRDIQHLGNPVALRSIVKTPVMDACRRQSRDFYYIDTGYFGNYSKGKTYHRIVKNAMQHLGPIQDRPEDRFLRTQTKLRSFASEKKRDRGSRVLVCPPSEKAMRCGWGLDLDDWMRDTVTELKRYTDREIVIREKRVRTERQLADTIWEALADDVYCLVTYNSIAAVEALIMGKPIFALGPNAAHHFARNDLSLIEDPIRPDDDEVRRFFCHLAYGQFTKAELLDGTAWSILRECW